MRATSVPAASGTDLWRRPLAVLLLSASTAWAALLWWAPGALAGRSLGWAGRTLAVASYAAGRTVCHQRPERSFAVRGVRQPVCARCAGLYLGAPVGVVVGLAMTRPRVRRGRALWSPGPTRRVLVWAAVPTLASLVVGWFQIGQPGNGLRFLLALPAGAAVGWVTASALLGEVRERVG